MEDLDLPAEDLDLPAKVEFADRRYQDQLGLGQLGMARCARV
jgi:hypothetical protein